MSIWMWLLLLLAAGMTALMLTAMVVGVRDTFHQRGKKHREELAKAWETGYAHAMHWDNTRGQGPNPYTEKD